MTIQHQFEQPVLFQQSLTWSRLIAWGIIGVTAFTLIWASVFEIEESISAAGKLEPKGAVKEIQASVGGVVKQIHVKDGQQVKNGEILISLEQTTTTAQLTSLQKNRVSLLQQKLALKQENDFYQSQIQSQISHQEVTIPTNLLIIKPELVYLTRSRTAIANENKLYRTQLNGTHFSINLTVEQKLRLQNRRTELASRLEAAKLETGQIQQQILQNQAQISSATELLTINQKILNKFEPLVKEGAISQLQYFKQQQDISIKKAEVIRLTKEEQRLQLALAESKEKLRNSAALSQEDLLEKITINDKNIAEIDSQLSKVILDNQKRILEINNQVSDIDSKLAQAKETIKYQTINSPVDGTVFEIKAKSSGFVVNSSEPMMKIVPVDNLVAKVYITNRDIGFVKEGQKVDIRIDSFPFQEYGDIKGELIEIGSDALPPDQVYQYWRFPAKVRLDKQALLINSRQVTLQSGMSVNTNIKLRKRTIMSIFTDFTVQKAESLKFVR
ncbi:HlyD family type I secretion periplasmic adaptor subunit [Dulcicalothrix desertica PCC 7102]|uniref:HlyD family type I secretion periplasmic adaptor subunit n=1 Tax=Dulcicalothrix desertica PCC 7102 TaxID=232991 RepID=A0A3S1DE26_9CYAN|nr:HlyD family efflux transporter periplasmic adaptor subunit [Dulcicalothrix desertica]RUT08282.1 HlyD family type I secretion periplasmic adaptor subunit [Dulcicalothrix desertica PCC 7102]TWH40149.1 HlyD family secretion protein [Dulcicalothrix desertica PCC 7102]